MDRKGIIAVTLASLVLAVWFYQSSKEAERVNRERKAAEIEMAAKAKAEAEANPPAPAPPAATAENQPGAAAGTPAASPAVTAPASVPEATEVIDTPSVEFTFTNRGGGIQRARLKNHKAEHGSNVEMNRFGAYPIGTISEGNGEQPLLTYTKAEDAPAGQIAYQSTDARQLQIRKSFSLPASTGLREEYLSTLEVTFKNNAAQPLPFGNYYIHTGTAAPIHKIDQAQYTGVAWSTLR